MLQLNIYDDEFRADPYPCFKKFREQAPISRIKPYNHWAIFRYKDVRWILKNDALFSSILSDNKTNDEPMSLLYDRSLVGMNGAMHAVFRKKVAESFKPALIKDLEYSIHQECHKLIENIPAGTPINFIEVFSGLLPVLTMARLMGLDLDKINEFRRWVMLLLTWRNQPNQVQTSEQIKDMYVYFKQVIEEKKQCPGNDLISHLLQSELPLDSSQLLSFMRLLLVAGTDTTTSLLNHSMMALADYPEQLSLFLTGSVNTAQIINETLRFNSPTISLIRRATEDVYISGMQVLQGDIILPVIASANHDETIFNNPHSFDLTRKSYIHLGLGSGIHYCLGSHLAKLQVGVSLEFLFSKFKTVKLFKKEPLNYISSFFFRSLSELFLIFS